MPVGFHVASACTDLLRFDGRDCKASHRKASHCKASDCNANDVVFTDVKPTCAAMG